jgi:sugar phosphate isomerase/epimerase
MIAKVAGVEMYTRRNFTRFAAGSAALAALPASRLFSATAGASSSGVRLGATTWSLRDLPRVPGKSNVDDLIKPLKSAGVTQIDLWSYNTEPAGPNTGPAAPPPPAAYPIKIKVFTPEEIAAAMLQARNMLRDWRLSTPPKQLFGWNAAAAQYEVRAEPPSFEPMANHYEDIRAKFDAAGIAVTSYNVKYDDSFTDDEINVTFHQAKVLGASSITAPGSAAIIKHLATFADKYEMNVAITDFTMASQLPSKRFKLNVDIGAIAAANGSPVAWIQENHDAIGQLTIKDRRRNKGINEKWGDGDTPVQDVLKLVKDKKYTFPVFADYEYIGLGTPAEELERCMDYMRSAVA